MHNISGDKLTITHNSGFFSCCAVALHFICEYFNENKELPKILDRSQQFYYYKENPSVDLSTVIYKNSEIDVKYVKFVDYFWEKQFEKYSELDFETLIPLVDKYFSPSDIILNKLNEIEKRISINYNDILAVCYRGNDKQSETKIGAYDEYWEKISDILKENKNLWIYIQTDEIGFLKYVQDRYKNVFFLSEIPMIDRNPSLAIQHIIPNHTNKKLVFTCDFLASVLFMSKCKHLITHSGNIGVWISLYRGNFNDSYQYLNGKWI